jgi:DNA-directed RNA polymerase specialized sigma54-like protein
MNAERFFKTVMTDFASDILKHESELERIINDQTMETDNKVRTIKMILKQIVDTEQAIAKFSAMMNNNNNQNTQENGQV